MNVSARRHRSDGPDDSNAPGCGRLDESADTGPDHIDDRHAQLGAEIVEACSCCGVAGNNDDFGAVVINEAVSKFASKAPHITQWFRAVRIPTGVTDVDKIFRRQEIDGSSRNGQTTEA